MLITVRLLLLSCVVLCAFSVVAADTTAPHTLVIVDDAQIQSSHSIFFQSLTSRGHTLVFREPKHNPSLTTFDKYLYDNLIIFAPTSEDLGTAITVKGLLEFVDSGRNVLVGASTKVSELLQEFANECGVDFDDKLSAVFDHQNVAPLDSGLHSAITTQNLNVIEPIVSPLSAPVIYEGIAHAFNPTSPLLLPLLRASPSSYSYLAEITSADKRYVSEPQSTGPNAALVTALQTQSNSARVVFSGSLRMFSNEFFAARVPQQQQDGGGGTGGLVKSGNEELCVALARWNFQDRGLLRTSHLKHHAVGKSELNPHTYRLSDNVEFSIVIEQFDGDKRQWVPFTGTDVHLEFVMMDPYHRAVLSHDGKGLFSHSFMIPDIFGIFKFRVQYNKPGWTNLDVAEQVGARPFRHNEYERFLVAAYPYYAGAASMMVGFFVFGIIFLYHKDEKIVISGGSTELASETRQ